MSFQLKILPFGFESVVQLHSASALEFVLDVLEAALASLLAVAVAAWALLEFGRPSFVVVGAVVVVVAWVVPFAELSFFAAALQPFAVDSCFSVVAFVFDDHAAVSVKKRVSAVEAFDLFGLVGVQEFVMVG